MPGRQKIDAAFDFPKLTAETEEFIKLIKQSADSIKNFPKVVSIYNGGQSFADFKKAYEEMIATDAKAKKSKDDLSASYKEYEKTLNQNLQTQAKLSALQTEAAKTLAASKEQVRQKTAEIKNLTIAENAEAGSLVQMKAQLALLTKEYDKMGAARRSSQEGSNMLGQIKATSDAIIKLEADSNRWQRNVGNYSSASSVLTQSLNDVRIQLDNLAKSGNSNSEQVANLRKEEELLNQVLNENVQGFVTMAQEIRVNEQALLKLESAGLADTNAYKGLQTQIAASKRAMTDFKQEQKLLSSPAPALQAATMAGKALAATYAGATGVTALFGEENSKTSQKLMQLVAVMSILQAITSANELLEKKSVFTKIASGLVDKANASWITLKNFALNGSVAATAASTTSTAVNTTATTAASAATSIWAGTLVALRAALIATGIGAILVLIAAVAMAFINSSSSTKTWEKTLKDLDKTNKDVADSLRQMGKTIEEVADNYITKLKEASKSLREELGKLPKEAMTAQAVLQGLLNKQDELSVRFARKTALEQGNPLFFMKRIMGIGENSDDVLKEIEKNNSRVSDVNNGIVLSAVQKGREAFRNKIEQRKKDAVEELSVNEELDVARLKSIGKTEKQIFDVQQSYQKKRALATIENNTILLGSYKLELKNLQANSPGSENIDKVQNKINELTKEGADARKKLLVDEYNFKDQLRQKNIANAQKEREALFLIEKLSIDSEIEQQKAISEIQGLPASTRMEARKKEYDEELKLAKLSEQNELAKAKAEKATAGQIEQIKRQSAKNIIDIENKLADDLRTIRREAAQQQKADEEKEARTFKEGIATKEAASLKNTLDSELQINSLNSKRLIEIELDRYKKGIINKEQYEERKTKIETDETKKRLDNQIAYYKSLLLIPNLPQDQKDAATAGLNAATTAKNELTDKGKETDAFNAEAKEKKAFDKKVERLQQYVTLAKKAEEVIGGFINARITREKNALQAKQNMIDANYAKEVAAIQASTLTEEEKANKLKVLEAERQVQTEQINKKKKQLDEQKARFDKKANMANIGMETALAVVRALGDKTTPLWLRIALAIAVGAMGALQVAAVAATPVPTYFKGRSKYDPYEGPAIAGEYRPEVLKRRDGSVEIIAKPSLINVQRGDEIFPDTSVLKSGAIMPLSKVNSLLAGAMTTTMDTHSRDLENKLDQMSRDNKETLQWHAAQLKNAIKSKAPVNVNVFVSDFKNSDYIRRNVKQ